MSATAHQLRRQADVERLHALAAASQGRLTVVEASPNGGAPIRVEIRCRSVDPPVILIGPPTGFDCGSICRRAIPSSGRR